MAESAIEILRGEKVESRVLADVAVVDSLGNLRYWSGDPDRETFWRSSAKPFQAMPMIEAGGADRFHMSSEEIAVCCASHGGEDFHLATVSGLMQKIGAGADDLVCGIHWPSHKETADRMMALGEEPTPLHNNCSGKHTGMLTFARTLGVPLQGYEQPDHPVQQKILENVSVMTGMTPPESIYRGVDGCGVPTFYLSLRRMAMAYARLVDPRGLSVEKAGAAEIIAEAMRRHPELVSGTGRLEVQLAQATGYRFVSKAGAEALFCMGLPEKGLGIAVKMDDGAARTLAPTVLSVLSQMNVLSAIEREALKEEAYPIIRNHAGRHVGAMRPVLQLHATRIDP
ncbi:MAG: asparaginase [Firmicutes bacterium]|nr:asparaginase [Bacillota bacterium]